MCGDKNGNKNKDGGDLEGRRRFLLAGALAAAGTGIAAVSATSASAQTPIRQPASPGNPAFAARAIAMRDAALKAGDSGYGAVIVKDGRIVGEAPSRVVTNTDPTAHAEIEAIRDAARRIGVEKLRGAAMFGSSPACPMCETAAYWAGLSRLFHGASASGGKPPRYGGC